MKIKFKQKNREIELDVKPCKSIFSKARGLILRKNSKPLLFIFKKPTREPIHSFFCKPFIAIWFNKDKIIEKRLIKPWKLLIKPKEKFDKLLEIPSDSKNFHDFTDDKRNL